MLRLCDARHAAGEEVIHLQGSPIPFLIELRQYVLDKASDFVTYLVQRSKNFYGTAIDAEGLADVLGRDGHAVVFFDGLDEVFDAGDRRRVIDSFQTFASRYTGARIIVTSRIAGYDRTALGVAGFRHYTLLPLTLSQMRHFAERWYRYNSLEGSDRSAHALVQRIVSQGQAECVDAGAETVTIGSCQSFR